MRGLPRLRLVLNSKLNPSATFNLQARMLPLHTSSTLVGSKTVFLGIVDLLKVAASPCTWLHGCRPAAPRLKRQPRRKGSSTAPRGNTPAMALSGRRHRGIIVRPPGGRRQMFFAQSRGRRGRRGRRRANLCASRAARGRTSYLTKTVLRVVDRPRAGRETR